MLGIPLRFTNNNRDFRMRFGSRLAFGALFTFAPVSLLTAQNAGKTLAMDFRTTVSVQGAPDTAVMTGHAVGTAEKMRLDVKGAPSQGSPLGTDTIITSIPAFNLQSSHLRPGSCNKSPHLFHRVFKSGRH